MTYLSFAKTRDFAAVSESGGSDADLGQLPVWNLTDLFPAMDSPEFSQAFDDAEKAAEREKEVMAFLDCECRYALDLQI